MGATRASKAGNKISYYNAQVSGFVQMNFTGGSFVADTVYGFMPFAGHITMTGSGPTAKYSINDTQYNLMHGGAVCDKGFRLMSAMYDECRLCRMNVKLQPATNIPNNVAVKLYSVVDKNFTRQEHIETTNPDAMDDDVLTPISIMENQSAVIQSFNGNRVSSLNRYSVPTDLKEKTGWMDCSISYAKNVGYTPLLNLYTRGWEENNSTYAPAFFYTAQTSVTADANTYITFSYTVEYSFAFRNPKSNLDRFIAIEQWGLTVPSAAKSTKTVEADPKTKKELEELAASLTTDEPEEEEEEEPSE